MLESLAWAGTVSPIDNDVLKATDVVAALTSIKIFPKDRGGFAWAGLIVLLICAGLEIAHLLDLPALLHFSTLRTVV